jgi:hypothetical protein
LDINDERGIGKPFPNSSGLVVIVYLEVEMTRVEIENFNTANAVVVIIVGKKGVPIVGFAYFCHHPAWYNVVSDGFDWDLRHELFHQACVRFVGKNCRCFRFDTVCVTLLEGTNIDVYLWKFREVCLVGCSLEEALLFEVEFHFS